MCGKIPSRLWVGMMIFWGTYVNYMFRTHYQISLLSMLKRRDNKTEEDFGPRYEWSAGWEQQSISAVFYGIMIISLPAGFFVTLIGPWNVLMYSSIIMALLSDVIVPMTHYVGPGGVFAMRILIGMMIGLQYPAMHNLISNWSPPEEKGKFVACMMGNNFASIVTMPLTSLVIGAFNWPWSFYYLSIVTGVYCLLLFLLVSDHPRYYRWIKEEEVEFIEASHGETVITAKKKSNPPYWNIIRSCPFIALIIGQTGNQYILFLAITVAPQYLNKNIGFNLKSSAGIAALPHVARLLSGFSYGALNDYFIRKGVAKNSCRKGFVVSSHILTGASLCIFMVIGDSSVAAVVLLVVMMVFNGAAVATVLINAQDLAPNWSGTLYGIMNFFGSIGGFVNPLLVKELTSDNTISEWSLVFFIGGTVSIVCGLVFIMFGSVEVQPWNDVETVEEQPWNEVGTEEEEAK